MKRKTKNNNTIGNTTHLLQGAVMGCKKGAAVKLKQIIGLLELWKLNMNETQEEMKRVGKYHFRYDVMSEEVRSAKLHIEQIKIILK